MPIGGSNSIGGNHTTTIVGNVERMANNSSGNGGTNNSSPLASRSQVTELLERVDRLGVTVEQQSRQTAETMIAVQKTLIAVNDNSAAMQDTLAAVKDNLATMQGTLAAVIGMVRTLAEGQAPIPVDTAQDGEEHGVWV
jgi:ABC-type transporter Mla subunit MlaD